MLEKYLLTLALSNNTKYIKYKAYIKDLKLNAIYESLFTVVDKLYTETKKDSISFDDMVIALDAFKTFKQDKYDIAMNILDECRTLEVSAEIEQQVMPSVLASAYIDKLSETIIESDPSDTSVFTKIETLLDNYKRELGETTADTSIFTQTDIANLLQTESEDSGLSWFCKPFQDTLGGAKKGRLGVVCAVPETGKTALALSIATHFAVQLPLNDCVLYVTNEQHGNRVQLRAIECALSIDKGRMFSNISKCQELYNNLIKDRLRILYDTQLSIDKLFKLCYTFKPSVLILDQVHQLTSPYFKGEETLRRTHLFHQLRILSSGNKDWDGCHIIGITQADGDAYNKKWLQLENISQSRIGVQGEADWAVGVGLDPADESLRYLHFFKNKEKDAHSKIVMRINTPISKYEEV